MPVKLTITGGDKLALLGKAIRRMGTDRTILNNLAKRIRKLAAPVKAQIKASATDRLPRHGGLNLWVAKAPLTVSVRRGVDNAGVSLRQGRDSKGSRSDLRSIDAGRTRHPNWGNRRHWSLQSLEAGYFTDAVNGPIVDEFQQQVTGALDEAIAEVLHGL
jgi:hypothetical protein